MALIFDSKEGHEKGFKACPVCTKPYPQAHVGDCRGLVHAESRSDGALDCHCDGCGMTFVRSADEPQAQKPKRP